jgi:cation transport regulator
MPYRTNLDLPETIQRRLPEHAQDIFREAFNNAWRQYARRDDQEEIAHRVAWAAVKKRFRKAGRAWVPLDPQ